MDGKVILEQFQDHLAPLLDTYEQAIYLYVLRHGRLQGLEDTVIGFKSNNSYRNVVASCLGCNNRKSDIAVEHFLRQLYREGFLSELDFGDRTRALQRLQAGEMKPIFSHPSG